MMFGNRKRFLRVGDRIFKVADLQMMCYDRKNWELHIHILDREPVTIEMDPGGFEKIARMLKYGKAKA
jgi:hypothetical protein